MTDRILVRHVPRPGVWPRAPLLTPNGRKATLIERRSAIVTHPVGDEPARFEWATVTDDWYVRLDDPLGLGLAGLAATVALRNGDVDGIPIEGLSVVDFIARQAEQDAWWQPEFEQGTGAERLCAIARYLALTDRLCAAVGLTLGEHEVAMWEELPPSDDPYSHGVVWALTTQAYETHFADYEASVPGLDHFYVPTIRPGTWLDALEAALASVRT